MKISVITICRNRKDRILRCMKSVKRQDYKNYEHIILDGASSDGTIEIIRENVDTKTVFITEPDSGIYDALNKAMKLVTGDIICLLHSDDQFYSDSILSEYNDAFSNNNDLDILFRSVIIRGKDKKPYRLYEPIKLCDGNLRRGLIPPHTGMVYRTRSRIMKLKYDSSFSSAGDFDYLNRIICMKDLKIEYSNECAILMDSGGRSTSGIKSYLRSTIEIIRSFQKLNKPANYFIICLRFLFKIRQFKKDICKLNVV